MGSPPAQAHEVLARKYRPQTFKEVIGQSAVVTTLLNALRLGKTAHAYLFSGSRGTGKTTLARLFAKALNCVSPTEIGEPCGCCGSCREIASGHSLDVIEIDGASNRGIDDIRQINETVGYAASGGKCKIYIIDEVHMLTKEAFNALLKTLEEPPKNVKFFFATTEPHKVLPTILSRCQHFQLQRIPSALIVQKLRFEATDMELEVEEEALQLIAKAADGGMRDAESLFDQVLAFTGSPIETESVAEILGLMPRDRYFALTQAADEQDYIVAFSTAQEVFDQGKDLGHFVEGLIEHYRTLLLVILAGKDHPSIEISEADRTRYSSIAKSSTREQCLDILDMLMDGQQHLRQSPCQQIALEAILLRLIRSQRRVPVDALVRKLMEIEERLANSPLSSDTSSPKEITPPPSPNIKTPAVEEEAANPSTSTPTPPKDKAPPPPTPKKETPKNIEEAPSLTSSVTEQSRYDTLIQFAAVELEGAVEKKR